MIHQLRERRNEDSGFTLIELMVVVLIIAILVAIAVPTFLGARTRGQDRAAQSTAKNALTAGRVHVTDVGTFEDGACASSILSGCLTAIETSIVFQASASTNATTVSAAQHSSSTSIAYYAVLSDSGTCWLIEDNIGTGGGTGYAKDDSSPVCTAADAETGGHTYVETGFPPS